MTSAINRGGVGVEQNEFDGSNRSKLDQSRNISRIIQLWIVIKISLGAQYSIKILVRAPILYQSMNLMVNAIDESSDVVVWILEEAVQKTTVSIK